MMTAISPEIQRGIQAFMYKHRLIGGDASGRELERIILLKGVDHDFDDDLLADYMHHFEICQAALDAMNIGKSAARFWQGVLTDHYRQLKAAAKRIELAELPKFRASNGQAKDRRYKFTFEVYVQRVLAGTK